MANAERITEIHDGGTVPHVFSSHLFSNRLILRRLQSRDALSLCGYRSLPEVARYQSWDTFSPDDAVRLIEEQSAAEPGLPGTWFQLAIIEAATSIMIGDCGLFCRKDEPRQMEVGITLSPAHQGRGYASEALECLVDFIFGALMKHRVSAITDAENTAALALFRRVGFREEAHFHEHVWFKGHWASEFVFAMLRRDWVSRRKRGLSAEKENQSCQVPTAL